jgi:hypothetical protein
MKGFRTFGGQALGAWLGANAMAKLRELDISTCDECDKPATHAVDTINDLYCGSYCLEHAQAELAKVQAEEDAGNITPKYPELTLDEFRALFKEVPG